MPPGDAHVHGKTDLSVVAVYLSNTEVAAAATGGVGDLVSETIRDLRNCSGVGSRPPFREDYADGNVPTYRNPRA